MSAFVIYDTEAHQRYVNVLYPDRAAADRALADLLRPYPVDHPWRLRLRVQERGAHTMTDPNAPTRAPLVIQFAPYIGIAGIMSCDETLALAECHARTRDEIQLQKMQPSRTFIEPELMLGVLVSGGIISGTHEPRQPRRYPSREQLALVTPSIWDPRVSSIWGHVNVALHFFCAVDGIDLAMYTRDLLEMAPAYTDAVQFNGVRPPLAALRAAGAWRGIHRVILQIAPRWLGEISDEASIAGFAESIAVGYGRHVSDVLVDASAGQGVAIAEDPVIGATRALRFCRALRAHGLPNVGYAGGLGLDNLDAYAPLLREGFSIDVESKLRDDADGGGNLDLDKAKTFLRRAMYLAAGVDPE